MDLHNLSDEQKRAIIDNYVRQLDEQHHQEQIASIGSGFIIFILIIVGGAAVLGLKGELGLFIGKGCFIAAVVIFLLTKLGKMFSGMSGHNPLN